MKNFGAFTSYVFILISLFIIIGLILLLHILIKSKNSPTIRIQREKVPLLSPKIYAFLVRHGIIGSGVMSKSFVKAMTFLSTHISNKEYVYSIPWYLILGPSNSGKSSILNSLSDLHLPDQGSNKMGYANCEWFMFMNGIVLEVKDNIFETGNTKAIVNKEWQLLSMLLSYFRPRKPLDGIILTLPVDLLLSEDKFPAQKKIMAQNMFENLFWMQNNLNLRIPIYLVITKCDILNGFVNICLGLNSTEKEQIFGWSSSYSVDTAYSASWVDEAFSSVNTGFRKTVLRIAANASIPEALESSLYIGEEFNKIKENLKIFTNTIFSPNSSGVELILRGIYLTGSDFEDGKSSTKKFSTLNPEVIAVNAEQSTIINFVKDLFCEKIFLEKNISQPILDNFIFHGKRVLVKRIIMTLVSLVLVLGFYFSHKHIAQRVNEFEITLTEIQSTIYQLKNNIGNKDLKDKTKMLLDYIVKLDPDNLYSPFVPLSWFSRLNDEIQETASNAFDKAIVHSMYSELEKKASTIKENLKVVLYNKIVLTPTDLEEFKALKKYISQVIELEKTGDSYNKVLISDDTTSVDNLAKFLYSDDIGGINVLKQKLKKDSANFKAFDLSKYKKEILKNIVTLQKAFIESCFSELTDKVFINLAANIENFVNDVEDQKSIISFNEVLDLYKKIETVINFLQSHLLNWWDNEEFSPSEEYKDLLQLMEKSKIITPEFIKSFKEYANAAFIDFKFRIANVSSTLTGHLVAKGRHIITSSPSNGFLSFYKNLKSVLQQKFILNIEDQDIVTEIPDDKILFWNNDLIKQSAKLIKIYNEFKNTTLKSFDINLRPLYKEIAKKLLNNSVKSLIAKAQILEDNSQNISAKLIEAAIKRSCDDVTIIFNDLIIISEFFQKEFSSNFSQNDAFIKMIFANYSKVLSTIDILFKRNEPFNIHREMFDTWDGTSPANFAGFSVVDQEDLDEYVKAQISRFIFLTKGLADPIVSLLKAKFFNFDVNNILLNKWSYFIDCADAYINKVPGNSLALLEIFIKKNLGEFKIEGIMSNNVLDVFLDIKKDIFLNKRANIARYLKFKAQEITYANSFIIYNHIAKFFNENIAGYFPFVSGYSNVYPDCGPEQLSEFLIKFKKISEPIKKALENLSLVNSDASDALLFIKKVEKAIPFLEGWLQSYYKRTSIESPIAFKMEFRVEKASEVGGDQIIDWRCKIGDQFITINDKDRIMLWDIGQEINVIFQWATESNEIPHADTKGLFEVVGQNAIFKYIGNWSIIRLIQANRIMSESYPGAGMVLIFQVPTVTKQNYKKFRTDKLFLKIKFLEKNKDKWVGIKIPEFPNKAPIIDVKMEKNVRR